LEQKGAGNRLKNIRAVEISPFYAGNNDLIQVKLTLTKAEIDIIAQKKE